MVTEDKAITQLLTIGVFYGFILGAGIWAGRKDIHTEDSTSSDLLLAGRKLPILVGVFTMTATWVGGGFINGTAEAVYDGARGLIWAQAPWAYAISLVLGGYFFAGKMRRLNFTTMLDVFTVRYGRRISALLFIPAVVGEIFWSAAILTALGTTFGVILNYDFAQCILISAAVAVGYTCLGGLRSVAYTDVIQLFCIFVGLMIALPFLVGDVGGIGELFSQYFDKFGGKALPLPNTELRSDFPLMGWIDIALLLSFGGIPWQVYFQRVLACPTEKIAKRLSYAAAVGCLVLALPAAIAGMVGAVTDWSLITPGAPPNAAISLPWILDKLTPTWVATIGLAAVAAAVMSSVDSSILSASSLFVWNVYEPFFSKGYNAKKTVYILRASIIVVGVISTWLALQIQSVYALWSLCADLVYVILFPQLLMALYFKRSNWMGAASGFVVGALFRIAGGERVLGILPFLPYPVDAETGIVDFPFRTLAMFANMVTIVLVSLLTSKWIQAKPLKEPQT